ncbi:MAG: ribonuclease PH [Nitrospirae bacterium]|nr:ribonuclease PH [Nitrospirota bacterium]
MPRPDNRPPDALRPVSIETGFLPYAEGSVLIRVGETHVAVSASVEERTPRWLRGKGSGWVTAEYGMLPRATHERTQREVSRGQASGRTQEIQRLVGRSLRAVTDLSLLGERTIWIDCDVLRADGGTRTASITGAFVALSLAVGKLMAAGRIARNPLTDTLAAVSVGIVDGVHMLDLAYAEDSRAQVDMNVVMTGNGELVEIQGTAEDTPFPRSGLNTLLDLAHKGVTELTALQRAHLPAGMPW